MPNYQYHCDGCGQTIERWFPMNSSIPETLYQEGHDAYKGDEETWPLACFGTLRRIYTMPKTNLGYRPHVGHGQAERYQFTHLGDRPLPSLL